MFGFDTYVLKQVIILVNQDDDCLEIPIFTSIPKTLVPT